VPKVGESKTAVEYIEDRFSSTDPLPELRVDEKVGIVVRFRVWCKNILPDFSMDSYKKNLSHREKGLYNELMGMSESDPCAIEFGVKWAVVRNPKAIGGTPARHIMSEIERALVKYPDFWLLHPKLRSVEINGQTVDRPMILEVAIKKPWRLKRPWRLWSYRRVKSFGILSQEKTLHHRSIFTIVKDYEMGGFSTSSAISHYVGISAFYQWLKDDSRHDDWHVFDCSEDNTQTGKCIKVALRLA